MDNEVYTKIVERLARIEVMLEQSVKRNTEIEAKLEDHEHRLIDVENAPNKKDASKWQYIMDYVFKFMVGGVVIYFASKMGIK